MEAKTVIHADNIVESIIAGYITLATVLERADAIGKWRWARNLAALLDAETDDRTRTETSKWIGEQIAARIGRPEPYSGSWVRMHAAAYRRFPQEPDDVVTQRAFLAAVNGNAVRSTKAASTSNGKTLIQDPVAQIVAAVRKAIEAGITVDMILATVQKEISE